MFKGLCLSRKITFYILVQGVSLNIRNELQFQFACLFGRSACRYSYFYCWKFSAWESEIVISFSQGLKRALIRGGITQMKRISIEIESAHCGHRHQTIGIMSI